MLSVKINYNGEKYNYPKGVSLFEIAKDFQLNYKDEIIIAKVDGILTELNQSIFNNSDVDFYDRNSIEGNRVYESGLLFVLIKAFKDEMDANVFLEHSLDTGVYIKTDKVVNAEILKRITSRMNEIIKSNLTIEKLLINRKEAIKYYERHKALDKVNLLKYNTNTNINLYKLDNIYDYFFNNLPISTGYLKEFKINLIDQHSFVLIYPNIYNNKANYKHHEKLFNEFEIYSLGVSKLGISSIYDLNQKVTEGKINDYILLSEANQTCRLVEIATKISSNKNIKIVLISGPSSSGKTTTSKKLQLFLKGFGLNPKTISIDDYYLDREKTPKKEDGTYDFETIKAIKIDEFNRDLSKLLKGEKVKIPTFNFVLGKGEYINPAENLGENDILIIEGLHALNDELTSSIEKKYKFKIYVSPLSVLKLDNHNRIKTSDIRLLRRIVRDNKYRGYKASDVLKSWESVREGEEQYVFPYQDEADVIFNTTLVYELGVLKTLATPLLYNVSEEDDNYKDAIRLLNLLKVILPIPNDCIPKDSIIREFIGDGYFN